VRGPVAVVRRAAASDELRSDPGRACGSASPRVARAAEGRWLLATARVITHTAGAAFPRKAPLALDRPTACGGDRPASAHEQARENERERAQEVWSRMSFQDVDSGATFEGLSLEGADGYAVKLPAFEGPLDLLLHLIRQNEVEITDIPIAEISAQYLQYLHLMRELNLDVAGEYLVMASTLALIKSRMLLPQLGVEEEGEAGDPRAELIARLLEYERYKEAAEALSRRRLLGRDVYAAQSLGQEPTPEGEREIEVGLFELIDAFRLVLEQAAAGGVHEIETESVSVRERMLYVMERLEQSESIEFNRIFETEGGGISGRTLIIATFLAILELARLSALHLYQGLGEAGSPTGPIRLRRSEVASEDGLPQWHDRISELM
jgi:segregation and condensation protein A